MSSTIRYNISEIFTSIQGEGPALGKPVIFVRFSGCNLRCKWGENLCDTPYTSWEPEKNMMTSQMIIEQMKKTAPHLNHVVITGGEPLIQKNITTLCSQLSTLGYRIDIETNGTGMFPPKAHSIVCSPKLSDSTPTGTRYEQMHAKERLALHSDLFKQDSRLYLKFVISSNTKIAEITELVNKTKCPPERVYLMPEGITREDIDAHANEVCEIAMQYSFCYSPRLHIQLWGNTRGV